MIRASHGLEGSKVGQILAKKAKAGESKGFHTFFPQGFQLTLTRPFGSWRSHLVDLVRAGYRFCSEVVSRAEMYL